MTDLQFDHYSHRVDHANKIIVELAITLLVEEDSPERSEFVQGFADGVMSLLRDLREKFPREKFDYYGVHFKEWLSDQPAQEPYLMSYDIPELPPSDEGEKSTHPLDIERSDEYSKGYIDGFEAGGGDVVDHAAKFPREKITQEEADDPVTVEEWLKFVLEEQREEDEELSHEKSDDCDDPFDLEDTLF
ncbi:hypothetical protein LCGC14_1153000, partial [marine sediment metagenome]